VNIGCAKYILNLYNFVLRSETDKAIEPTTNWKSRKTDWRFVVFINAEYKEALENDIPM